MKKYYNALMKGLLLLVAVFGATSASAKWEKVYDLTSTYACHVTKSGNILLSDYQYMDYSGGIYISEDNGQTWTKTDVEDHCYSSFYAAGDYIFAAGEGCCLARSADEGKTWEVLSFAYVYADYLTEDELFYNPCYAIAYHKGKLYVGDFNGGGVAYSEDFGETWALTDRESLMYDISGGKAPALKDEKPTKVMENFYNMVSFNDDLYLFGVYFVYRLNEETGLWETIRSDSNFMGITTIFNDTLVCGRSVMNYGDHVPFLETTQNGDDWGEVKRPEGMLDNNVRTMSSDATNLYVGLQQGGMYYTPDFGDTWHFISEGLPHDVNGTYYTLLSLVNTDDYLYVAVYDSPWAGNSLSGLYRMAKSDLPKVSVDALPMDEVEVYVEGGNLVVSGDYQHVAISTLQGVTYQVEIVDGKADISSLDKGIYIYALDRNRVGKFVKK